MNDRDVAEAKETAIDQVHQLLVEVKDYLEGAGSRKGVKLLGKVELVLDSWDDDTFFSEEEDDEDEGGEPDQELDEDDDEGSILDAGPEEDEEDENDD